MDYIVTYIFPWATVPLGVLLGAALCFIDNLIEDYDNQAPQRPPG